ncbi:MAG: hypothetical protein ABI410_19575 [Rhodoferax sp.]|uniref:hypothetical protein n=1 Tax=Rhodoferax sp. TaxID=50421 RepID=UPI003265C12F
MTTATVSQNTAQGLPPGLRSAQAAVHLPEVQEMLRRLSGHGLGIFMPHMHDDRTGDFLPLPDEVMQVEAGLEVSFRSAAEITLQAERFLPVAWLWRANAVTAAAACEMVKPAATENDRLTVKHKMSERI